MILYPSKLSGSSPSTASIFSSLFFHNLTKVDYFLSILHSYFSPVCKVEKLYLYPNFLVSPQSISIPLSFIGLSPRMPFVTACVITDCFNFYIHQSRHGSFPEQHRFQHTLNSKNSEIPFCSAYSGTGTHMDFISCHRVVHKSATILCPHL